jgi:glyoxylase-like metal-dependent hydrolase (beta-lactamase superfamily II)
MVANVSMRKFMDTFEFEFGGRRGFVVADDELYWPMNTVVGPTASDEDLILRGQEFDLDLAAVPAIPFAINHLLVTTDNSSVLIDAGSGMRPWSGGNHGRLAQNLPLTGLGPEDIDAIVITHSDYDHIGGILNSRSEHMFPNARYYLSSTSWGLWSSETGRAEIAGRHQWPEDRIAFVWDTYARVRDRLSVVDHGDDFLSGFSFVAAPGHRLDNDAVRIEVGGEVLMDLGDSLIHPLVIAEADWYFTYDVDPDAALKSKLELLDRCLAEDALVFGTHFPSPGLGRFSRDSDQWAWNPIPASL